MAMGITLMAFASPTFKSIDNYSNKTTVIVEVDSIFSNHLIQDVVFHNCGKTYECKELKTALNGGKLTISASFKKFKTFENCYMTFMLNGQMHKVKVFGV